MRPMKALVALLAAACVATAVPGAHAEETGSTSSYIVGGSPADVNEYPFVVFLQIGIGSQNFMCGGSLVDPWYVLTAAHCVEEDGVIASPGNITATIGRTNLTSSTQGEVRGVSAVEVHPAYDTGPGRTDHDVAVLRLSSASTRPPIELAAPYQGSDQGSWLPGSSATVIGWGRTCGTCTPTNWLQEVTVPVRGDSEGVAQYGSDFNGAVHVAAGASGVDSCGGDSGGPLFVNTSAGVKQIGVVSWGPSSCSGWPPGVYAEVGGHRLHPWVRSVIRETPVVGDFNGDGRDDIATFTHQPAKDVWVALSTGSAFGSSSVWHTWLGNDGSLVRTGDYDGDGRDDVWAFSRDHVWVARSEGWRFNGGFSRSLYADHTPVVGDVDGDGRDDLVLVKGYTLRYYRSTGSGLTYMGATTRGVGPGYPAGDGTQLLGDVTGDGRDDLVVFPQGTSDNRAYVLPSTGSGFGSSQTWHDWFALRGETPVLGQFGGSSRTDVATFTRDASRDVWVALSWGYRFGSSSRWHYDFGQPPNTLSAGDFNGDGLDDIVNFTQDANADAIVAINAGGTFGVPRLWHGWFAP